LFIRWNTKFGSSARDVKDLINVTQVVIPESEESLRGYAKKLSRIIAIFASELTTALVSLRYEKK